MVDDVALDNLLDDGSGAVQLAAAKARFKTGRRDRRTLDTLKRLKRDPDSRIGRDAKELLREESET